MRESIRVAALFSSAHAYFDIDTDIIWVIVRDGLRLLIRTIEVLLKQFVQEG